MPEISAEPILSFNFSYLEGYVQDIASGDEDIAYAVITDKDGNALTHQKAAPADKTDILEFTSPVMQNNDRIGSVTIGISTKQMQKSLSQSRLIITALSVGTMVVISLLVFFLFRVLALEADRAAERGGEEGGGGRSGAERPGRLLPTRSAFCSDRSGRMIERLKAVVGDVKNAANNVAAGSQQVSVSSEQMSRGASAQAASAEEASSSIEEMNAAISQNAGNAVGYRSHRARRARRMRWTAAKRCSRRLRP